MSELRFMAFGDPVPQGSKQPFKLKTGQIVLVESAKGHKSWRQTVKEACKEAVGDLPPLDGPLEIHVWCFLKKPKKTKFENYPAVKPDGSKLLRSIEDSITDAGGWVDDARAVDIHVYKRWAGVNGNSPSPGCSVFITKK